MNLLSFLDVSIELGDTSKSELVHEIDAVSVRYKFLAESLDSDWECCTKKANLVLAVTEANELL